MGRRNTIKLDHDFRRPMLDYKNVQWHLLVSMSITALAPLGDCWDVAADDFGMLLQARLCHLCCLLRPEMFDRLLRYVVCVTVRDQGAANAQAAQTCVRKWPAPRTVPELSAL